jgi:hypothetical protein
MHSIYNDEGAQKDGSQTQSRWSKGYALHEELYGCHAFLEYILLCHTNKWTPMKAHAHLKTHIAHIGNLTVNELAAVALWCNLQYRMERVCNRNNYRVCGSEECKGQVAQGQRGEYHCQDCYP